MIRHVIVDVETTGLDPQRDQILEVAAMTCDGAERFHKVVKWDRVEGHPVAMAMNATLLRECCQPEAWPIDQVVREFQLWLERLSGKRPAKLTPAGKNFGGFDLQFLLRAGLAEQTFRRRGIDPAAWFAVPEDEVLPDLQSCLSRAGITYRVEHRAFADCEAIRLLIARARELGVYKA